MKQRLLACLFIILLSPMITSDGHAGNPFTTQPVTSQPATTQPVEKDKSVTAPVKHKIFVKILFWQQQLREKMSTLIREAKSEKKSAPFFILALSAFLYGVLHSAGPGHGKAIALSYILSCKPRLYQGIIFGLITALVHGFSGIFLVLAVKFILHAGMTQSLDTVTHITQIVSFSLISILGVLIFINGLTGLFNKLPDSSRGPSRIYSNPYMTAVVIGLVPCPGVVMVMLFAVSMELTFLGIFLGTCIALGMAATITLIILTAMSGKSVLLKFSNRQEKYALRIEPFIKTIAGFAVASLGLVLLMANL